MPIQFNVLNDYPPKFIINAVQISPHADSECPQLVVKGLDDECAFGIIIGTLACVRLGCILLVLLIQVWLGGLGSKFPIFHGIA